MSNGLKSGLVLLTLGLICGLLLALVNGFTAERIAAEELRLKTQTISEYYSLDDYYIEIEEFEEGNIDSIFYIKESKDTNEIHALAYSVSANGYGGKITVLVVIQKDLTVQDYKVISHSENGPGAVVSDYDFNYNQADSLSSFDGISGATYSSNAMREIFSTIADRVESDMGV